MDNVINFDFKKKEKDPNITTMNLASAEAINAIEGNIKRFIIMSCIMFNGDNEKIKNSAHILIDTVVKHMKKGVMPMTEGDELFFQLLTSGINELIETSPYSGEEGIEEAMQQMFRDKL
jgi:hypothetical protein